MKTIAFFNNKGGVGKTSLVFHLAHMFADLGVRTVAVDLDPQANLTSMFMEEDELEAIWTKLETRTIYSAIRPLIEGEGDVAEIRPEFIKRELSLIIGDSLAVKGRR